MYSSHKNFLLTSPCVVIRTSCSPQSLLHDVSSSKAELQNKIIMNGKLQAIISLLSMLAALYSSLVGGGEGGVEDELEKAIYDSIR